MSLVTPAVLPNSRAELDVQLEKLAMLPGVSRIQLDIVDGRLAAPASWPFTEQRDLRAILAQSFTLPQIERFSYEIDLMVYEPDELIGPLLEAGATRIVIHVESTGSLVRLLAAIRQWSGHEKDFAPSHLAIGLAFDIATDLSAFEPLFSEIDFIQFMGIAAIGRQGEPFDERVLEKIKTFHAAHPDIPMQVDGGVSLITGQSLVALGVQNLVVGSALIKSPNMHATFEKFENLVSPYGV